MKGLRQYIRKHGWHFTEELAMDVTNGRWDSSEVMGKVEGMVYYNVTDSTVGDMVFLVNYAKNIDKPIYRTKYHCLKFALCVVDNYAFKEGTMFRKWTEEAKDFDFTPYI